jgi:hypothetical protein
VLLFSVMPVLLLRRLLSYLFGGLVTLLVLSLRRCSITPPILNRKYHISFAARMGLDGWRTAASPHGLWRGS